jgi:ATP-binding cassette subfamily F protein 3
MMLRPCNLLLLDEPTNHLDIKSREALLNALDDFPGTIIIVSHDRFFLDSLATKVLALENGNAVTYEGNYSQYLWARKHRLADNPEISEEAGELAAPISDKKQQARDTHKLQKKLNNRIQKVRKEIENKELEIAQAEEKVAEIEQQLAAPPAGWSPEKVVEASNLHMQFNNDLEGLLEDWENMNSELSEAEAELAEIKEN